MAPRCFCGCGQTVPRRLRIIADLGQAIGQRRRDLQSLLDAGLESPRGERLIGVMISNENVLAQSIHDKEPPPAEIGAGTSDVLVLYELLFGAEALFGIQTKNWASYSDEMLRDRLGIDLAELEIVFNGRAQPAEPSVGQPVAAV